MFQSSHNRPILLLVAKTEMNSTQTQCTNFTRAFRCILVFMATEKKAYISVKSVNKY